MKISDLQSQVEQRWPDQTKCRTDRVTSTCEIECSRAVLTELCGRLFLSWNFSFAGLIVEEDPANWQLRYCFYGDQPAELVHVLVQAQLSERTRYEDLTFDVPVEQEGDGYARLRILFRETREAVLLMDQAVFKGIMTGV